MLLRFCLLILLCTLSFSGSVSAQVVTALPLIRDTLTGGSDPSQNLPLPEPTALQGGWWHYFDVEDKAELQSRIDAVLERLQTLLTELPDPLASDANAFVELIGANLQALPEAREQVTPKPPAPSAYQDNYSLQQVLELANRHRTTSAQARIMTVDVDAAERAISAVNKRLDTELAAYLEFDPNNPKRTMLGLQIMAERSSLIVAQQRLRVNKGDLQVAETLSKQLNEELKIVRERLSVEANTLDHLRVQIVEAEQALEQAHNQSIKAQAGASKIIGNEPGDKATGLYRRQRAINAAVAEASAKVRVLKLYAEQALAGLLLDAPLDTKLLRQQLAERNSELNTLKSQITVWRESSERERERTGTTMAGTAAHSDEDATVQYLDLLNQNRFSLAQETLVAIKRLESNVDEINLIILLVDDQLLRKEGRLRDWLAWFSQSTQSLWGIVNAGVNESLFKIGDTPVTALGLLRIVLILTVAWLLSYWLRRVLAKLGTRGDGSNLPAYYTVGRLSHYLLVIVGFLVGLSSIGMDFTNFALVAGALAIGIGFGLQAIVNNFISGLILLFERSLKVGDFVELASGVAGEVKAINVRSTQIKTNENIDIVVPNSEFMNTNVINWTLQEPYMRVHYPFRIAFGMDKDLVRKAGLEAVENLSHTLSGIPGKNPQVWLVGYGENGYNFELVVWLTPSAVKRPQAVRAAYYWELETALSKYAIEVPVPQRDLRLREGFSNPAAVGPNAETSADLNVVSAQQKAVL